MEKKEKVSRELNHRNLLRKVLAVGACCASTFEAKHAKRSKKIVMLINY